MINIKYHYQTTGNNPATWGSLRERECWNFLFHSVNEGDQKDQSTSRSTPSHFQSSSQIFVHRAAGGQIFFCPSFLKLLRLKTVTEISPSEVEEQYKKYLRITKWHLGRKKKMLQLIWFLSIHTHTHTHLLPFKIYLLHRSSEGKRVPLTELKIS